MHIYHTKHLVCRFWNLMQLTWFLLMLNKILSESIWVYLNLNQVINMCKGDKQVLLEIKKENYLCNCDFLVPTRNDRKWNVFQFSAI